MQHYCPGTLIDQAKTASPAGPTDLHGPKSAPPGGLPPGRSLILTLFRRPGRDWPQGKAQRQENPRAHNIPPAWYRLQKSRLALLLSLAGLGGLLLFRSHGSPLTIEKRFLVRGRSYLFSPAVAILSSSLGHGADSGPIHPALAGWNCPGVSAIMNGP